jgi:hypothetical protein
MLRFSPFHFPVVIRASNGLLSSLSFTPMSLERTVFSVPLVHLYLVDPVGTEFNCQDWTNHIFDGQLKVVEQADKCTIHLLQRDGTLFAVCPVGSSSDVLKAADSSRYFVIRIIDEASQRQAFVGIGFDSREEAFDFSDALLSHDKQKLRQAGPTLTSLPRQDFSLKQGEKISVSLAATAAPRRHGAAAPTSLSFSKPAAAGPARGFAAPPAQALRSPFATPHAADAAPAPEVQSAESAWLNF